MPASITLDHLAPSIADVPATLHPDHDALTTTHARLASM
jgi:hypothetical protein